MRPGRVLAFDRVPTQLDGCPALTNIVYDGGVLDEGRIASLRLTYGELKRWRFCTRVDTAALLRPHMKIRMIALMAVVLAGALQGEATAGAEHLADAGARSVNGRRDPPRRASGS